MRALCYHGRYDIRCDTVPDPEIEEPRDAIVKVAGCAICGSDLHLYDGFMPGMMHGDIMGHEFMGEVVEVGRGNAKLKVGSRRAGGASLYSALTGRREGDAWTPRRNARAGRRKGWDPVDEAIDESFPASDPPSCSPTGRTRHATEHFAPPGPAPHQACGRPELSDCRRRRCRVFARCGKRASSSSSSSSIAPHAGTKPLIPGCQETQRCLQKQLLTTAHEKRVTLHEHDEAHQRCEVDPQVD